MLLYEESKALEKALGEEAAAIVVKVFERQNAVVNAELASKADLREEGQTIRAEIQQKTTAIRAELRETEMRLQLEIEKVRSETEKVRGEVKETEARLRVEMEKVRSDLLRWQFGIGIALALIMAKGFGWLGF